MLMCVGDRLVGVVLLHGLFTGMSEASREWFSHKSKHHCMQECNLNLVWVVPQRQILKGLIFLRG